MKLLTISRVPGLLHWYLFSPKHGL